MRVLIFYSGTPALGGIETLLFRLVRYLQRNSHSAKVYIRDARPIAGLMKDIAYTELGAEFAGLLDPSRLRDVLHRDGVISADMAIALDTESALIVPLVRYALGEKSCVPVATVWTPNYFSRSHIGSFHPKSFLRRWNLKRNFTKDTMFVMMEKYRDQGVQILGPEWDASLLPIPVNLESFYGLARDPIRTRLVSVGRLDEMKGYNLYMVSAVRTLRSKGYDVHWDVYGDGDLRVEMERMLDAQEMRDYVTLHGNINYEEFPAILRRAGIFVGMGTASIEAAAAGVPGPVAIGFDKNGLTHGDLLNMAFGNCGEMETGRQLRLIEDEIEALLLCTDEAYYATARVLQERARSYDEGIVWPRLLEAAKSAIPSTSARTAYTNACKTYVLVKDLSSLLVRRESRQ